MKNSNRFRFAFYSFVIRKKSFLLAAFLMAISLVLCGMSVMYCEFISYNEKSTNQVLSCGIKQTGIIDIDQTNWDDDTANRFRKELMNSGVVCAVGAVEEAALSTENCEKLAEIQHKNIQNSGEVEDDEIEVIMMDVTVLKLCHMELLDEKELETDEPQKVTDTYSKLYLGYNFKDIPIGTVVKQEYLGVTYTYEVAGILKKGEKFVKNDLMYNVDMNELRSYKNLDNEIIYTYESGAMAGRWFFATNDSTDMNKNIEKIYSLGEKYGGGVMVAPIFSYFREAMEEMDTFIYYLIQMGTVIITVSIIVVITQQLTAMFRDLREYGIMYALGCDKRDIFAILLFENVIKVIMAIFAATVLSIILGEYCFSVGQETKAIFYGIFISHVMPFIMGMAVIYTLTASIISMIVFRTYTPVELLTEKNR